MLAGSERTRPTVQDPVGRVLLDPPHGEEMLSIRLRRMGSSKKPYFRVMVMEARSARDSSFVENVGTYHPRAKPAQVNLNKARIEYWLTKGAKPSDSVRTLLGKHLTRDLSAAPSSKLPRPADGRGGRIRQRRPDQGGRRGGRARTGRSSRRGACDGERAARHDGLFVDDGAGRHGQAHRTAGTNGCRLEDARGVDCREARQESAAGHTGLMAGTRDSGFGIR